MKCSLCDIVFEVEEKSIELLTHMNTTHVEIANIHKSNPDANVGFRIEFLQVNVLDDEAKTPILLEELCEDTDQKTSLQVAVDDKEDVISTQYIIEKGPKPDNPERKRSWVWKYFDKLSNIMYRCNLCSSVLSIKGSNTNNMNRHVKSRHSHVYKREVYERATFEKQPDAPSEFASLDKTENIEGDSEFYPDLTGKKKSRSWVWSYFKRLSATQAQCKICRRQICHGGNATGNMNRHLKIVHNRSSGPPEKSNVDAKWIWKVFEECDDSGYSCKICQFRCQKNEIDYFNIRTILKHLKRAHGVVSGEQIITGTDCEQEQD